MCAQVLGGPLHHGPTRGGRAEAEKFADWYGRTLESYREWFGEEPPGEIWPPSATRFGLASHFRRVNKRRVWVIAKPKWLATRRNSLRLPRVGLPRRDWMRISPLLWLWMLTGCAELQTQGPNVFNWHGPAFLGWFWTLSVLGLAFGFWRKNALLLPDDADFPAQPLDAAFLGHLRDPQNGAVDVTLAMLYQRGALEVLPGGTLRATGAPVALSPFERAVLSQFGEPALSSGDNTSGESSVRAVREALKPQMALFDGRLRDLGLFISRETRRRAANWPIGVTLALIAIGAIKIGVGVSRDRPVGLLVLSCAILSGFLVYFLCHSPRRSKRGQAYLAHLNRQAQLNDPHFNWEAAGEIDLEALSIHMALIGTPTYPPEMQRAMRPPSEGGSGGEYYGGADGSSDGGGDGGGGCGGCGGGD